MAVKRLHTGHKGSTVKERGKDRQNPGVGAYLSHDGRGLSRFLPQGSRRWCVFSGLRSLEFGSDHKTKGLGSTPPSACPHSSTNFLTLCSRIHGRFTELLAIQSEVSERLVRNPMLPLRLVGSRLNQRRGQRMYLWVSDREFLVSANISGRPSNGRCPGIIRRILKVRC